MKALLDEQLSPRIATHLRAAGHDVVAAAERTDLAGSSDRIVLEVATEKVRAVITNNIKDYRPLGAARLRQGQAHAGLILVPATRSRTRSAIPALVAAIARILDAHPDGIASSERWTSRCRNRERGWPPSGLDSSQIPGFLVIWER